MLIHIVARGKIGRSPEAELVARYLRLPDTGGKLPPVEPGTRIVMLDETGESPGSIKLAERIGRWRDDGTRELRFMIGAADGFDDADRASADMLLSFGRMTWPHMLARAMLAEQIWRASSILANHPYHREG
jgi:23S rRNA (pseudouridine1915-N3)-methyltransferase